MIPSPNQSDTAHEQLKKNLTALAATHLFAPMRTEFAHAVKADQWSDCIARMLDVGYAFDATQFDVTQSDKRPCIFRGQPSGFMIDSADPAQQLTLVAAASSTERHSSLFERTFGVQFVSHEISDALTVSGLFDPASDLDNAIIAIDASNYNEANKNGEAASLAVGDAGHVFRYPFLTRQLTQNDIVVVFADFSLAQKLRGKSPALQNKIVVIDSLSQSETEQCIRTELSSRGLCAARASRGGRKPRRNDLFTLPVCTVADADERTSSRVS